MEHISDYERIRLGNIKRNREFMGTLGLDVIANELASNNTTRPAKQKRQPSSQRPADESIVRRRSSRIQGITTVDHDGSIIDTISEQESRITIPRAKRQRPSSGQDRSQSETRKDRPVNPDSRRILTADTSVFLQELLGKPVPGFGKASVMNLAHQQRTPSFNKFSGVVEWSNCLFLWVNIGGSEYENMFLDQGEKITWFGGSRMYADSPATTRLLSTRLQDELPSDQQEGVLLFCRHPDGPYVCLGRVRCAEFDLDATPLRFIWRLMDYDRLRSTEHFQQFLKA